MRADLSWNQVEGDKGQYNFSAHDALLASLKQRGIRLVLTLASGNNLYDGGLSPHTDEGRAAFAAFASAAAAHFAGEGVIWDFWGEPEQSMSWKPAPNLANWALLAKATVPAIRRADPQAIILGPGISHADPALLDTLGKLGVLQLFDAIAVHPYRPEAPESVLDDYSRLRGIIGKYSPDKPLPIVSTEWGYARNYWPMAPELTDELQASYLARELLVNLAAGVRLSIWYDWSNDGDDLSVGDNNFGLLDLQLNPKPAYFAMRTLADTLRGYHFVASLPQTSLADYVLQFELGAKRTFAVWTTSGTHLLGLPVACSAVDIVQLLGEKKTAMVESGVLTLRVSGSPQYVNCAP